MKQLILFLLLTFSLNKIFSQTYNIIPAPVSLQPGAGSFSLTSNTQLIVADSGDTASANFLNIYLQRHFGFTLKVAKEANANFIRLTTKKFIAPVKNEGRYSLNVTNNNVVIEGDTYMGTFYGIQTLIQLLPIEKRNELSVSSVTVTDYPRFSYRGMHLDVARHFFDVDFVKRYIDFLALHKLNTFHWHLTDDQGWRIEIKKYPKLTSVGGFRNGTIIGRYPGTGNDNLHYGGFYTQEEIKEVVKYAANRFITVIPEIELPGHASAAIAAYPELSCFPQESTQIPAQAAWSGSKEGKQVQQTWGVFPDVFCPTETTFGFFEAVFDEVLNLFPSQYIHVGGDECPKDAWKRSEFCQQLIKEKGLKDEHGLQSYFIQRIEKYINSKGRKIIGWDEILEGGLAPNATVMSWQGEKGGIEAAKQKHNVIMTPGSHVYFDHSQSKNEDSVTFGGYTSVEKVYSYEPVPKELDSVEAKYVLGAQANLWTEYISNPAKIEYQLFPRLSALSEVLWSPKSQRNTDDFEKKLLFQFKRLDFWKVNYSKAYLGIQSTLKPTPGYDGLLWTIESKSKGDKFISDLDRNTGIKYTGPVLVNGSANLEASVVEDNKTVAKLKNAFSFNKATGRKITLTNPPSSAYPGPGGAFGLVNGLKSEKGFLSAEWLGWFNKDLEAVIDFGKTEQVSKVSIDAWRQEPSYIYLPKGVTVLTSMNGTNWSDSISISPKEGEWQNNRKISLGFKQPVNARFMKVIVTNNGIVAEGKPGAGKPCWLFVDEIEVE